MIIIGDSNVCSNCGGYFSDKGVCCNCGLTPSNKKMVEKNMNELLLQGLMEQLEEEGACVFKHKESVYRVFMVNDELGDDFYYEKYSGFDSKPLCYENCESNEAEEAILFAIS